MDSTNKGQSDTPPKIDFPCDYPIKVICDASPDLVEKVLGIMTGYDATLTNTKVELNPSKKGNYCSVRVAFRAAGEPQLKRMFEELKTHSWVRMVL